MARWIEAFTPTEQEDGDVKIYEYWGELNCANGAGAWYLKQVKCSDTADYWLTGKI